MDAQFGLRPLAGSVAIELDGADRRVLCLRGDVDTAVAARFASTGRRDRVVVDAIDAGAVTFISSSGLALLLMCAEASLAAGRHLVLRAASRPVDRALALAGIDALFPRAEPDGPRSVAGSGAAGGESRGTTGTSMRQDRPVPTLRIAQDPAADELLSRDPLALLLGMLLDQQFPIERAFGAPRLLADRLGVDSLDAARLAGTDADELTRLFQGPPALHRYPGSMAGRTQELCRLLVDRYDGRAENLWADAPDGSTLLERLNALPGFGAQKSRIFLALLGKQYGVEADGWREAAGDYGQEGARRSVADITGPESLTEVRAFKQEQKQLAKKSADRAAK